MSRFVLNSGGNRFPVDLIAWVLYSVGWIVWLASMAMKVTGFLFSSLGAVFLTSPVAIVCYPGSMAMDCVVLGYYLGFIACLCWPWLRRWRWARWPLPIAGLGLLASWLVLAAITTQRDQIPVWTGALMNSVGSTMICLGVWLIPARQKRGTL